MGIARAWTAFCTILIKEVRRFLRIWPQTLLPPVITMSLYLVIFGRVVGARIGDIGTVSYTLFVVPGLIMMSVISNSYNNVASSFFSNKFQRSIEELQVAPVPHWIILSGFVLGGVTRGLLTALVVMGLSFFFVDLPFHSVTISLCAILLTATIFSLGGFLNGMLSRKFDDVTIVPTFILTPLTYLGGVFYSLSVLPDTWYLISRFNPVVYQINALRYGLLGQSDLGEVGLSFVVMVSIAAILFAVCLYFLKTGKGLRS